MTSLIRTVALLSALLACAVLAGAQEPQDAMSKRVSLDLKAMAPAEAFKVIATAVGYTVDVSQDLTTPVDVVIPNVTARTALTTICESIGCTWQANGTVIVVRKRAPGGTLGRGAHAAGTAAGGHRGEKVTTDVHNELTRRLNTILPPDMKFENAPISLVAERLSKAIGLEISFVSEKTGQTLTADMGNKTLSAALKTLTEQYQGAILMALRDGEGKNADRIMLQLGTANKPRKPPKK